MRELGVRARGGLILAGPPGTGKTSICRDLSARLDCTFLWVTPGDLECAEEVHEAFALARWLAPTVVVLEDLDLIAESRRRGNRSAVLGQLMSELDGVGGDHPLLTIATTNQLEVVEEALRSRPGRFDRILEVGALDDEQRRALLDHRLGEQELEEDLLAWFAGQLGGATGAEVEETVNLAVTLAHLDDAGADRPAIRRSHLETALDECNRLIARRCLGFGTDD